MSSSIEGKTYIQPMVGLCSLKKVKILVRNDFHDLARLLLRINDARDKGRSCRSRHTVRGVAAAFCMITGVSLRELHTTLEKYGLPLGATVEHDRDVTTGENKESGEKAKTA